jgi:hypothetical protein
MRDTARNESSELSRAVADTQNRTLLELVIDVLKGLEVHRKPSPSSGFLHTGDGATES